MWKWRNQNNQGERGFSLIEMIVSVALFATVMLVSTTTLLSLVGANRKSQALQSVMNNLNIALEGMVRSIRMGTEYHCGGAPYSNPQDCQGGDTFAFQSFEGERWIYWFAEDANGIGRIYKSETGDMSGGFAITAPSVSIEELGFYVVGTARGVADAANVQPKVVIVLKGAADTNNARTVSSFAIQATAVQRVLDL